MALRIAAKISPKAAGNAIKNIFKADTRIRVTPWTNAHEVYIAKAERTVRQQTLKVEDAAPDAADRATITNAIQNKRPLPPKLQAAANIAKDFLLGWVRRDRKREC